MLIWLRIGLGLGQKSKSGGTVSDLHQTCYKMSSSEPILEIFSQALCIHDMQGICAEKMCFSAKCHQHTC